MFKTLRKLDLEGTAFRHNVKTTWICELWYSRTLVQNIVESWEDIFYTLLWQPLVLLRIDCTGDCEEGAQKFWGGEEWLGQYHHTIRRSNVVLQLLVCIHTLHTCNELLYVWMTNLMVQASWQSDMEFSSLEVVVLSAVQDTVVGGAGCFVCAQCHA